MKLHNKGWGYTKIHRHLLKNGFEIGKSRTIVDSIIKNGKNSYLKRLLMECRILKLR